MRADKGRDEFKELSSSSFQSTEQCPTHKLPIVVNDSITGQKFCRICLMSLVEGEDLKSKHRNGIIQTIDTMFVQLAALSSAISSEHPLLMERFGELGNQADEVFDAIIAGVNAEREAYRKQLFQRKSIVQDTLSKSIGKVEGFRDALDQLNTIVKKPLSSSPVDLVTIEHQVHSLRKGILMEEKKIAGINSTLMDSEIYNDYSSEKLKIFLNGCIRMNIVDKAGSKMSGASPDEEIEEALEGPSDSVSENFEPVLCKFVWNTRQADCYQVLKNIFCTLTIPTVIAKDQEVHNASFVIPKFSKSILTEYNRVYLTGGAKLDTMEPRKFTFEFELETLKLIKKANMRQGRYHHAAAYMTNFIYVCGGNGTGSGVTLNSCERYDIAHDYWVELAKMTYPRSCHTLCVFGELMLFAIFGQVTNEIAANSVEKYEIVNDTWVPISLTLPKGFKSIKHMSSYSISKDEILIFGGANVSSNQFYSDSYIFYPSLGEFHKCDKMKSATIFRNQPLCYKNRIYAFGVDNYIHFFDIQFRKWEYIYDRLS